MLRSAVCFACALPAVATCVLSPIDPRITYIGRFDVGPVDLVKSWLPLPVVKPAHSTDKTKASKDTTPTKAIKATKTTANNTTIAQFGWSGSQIACRFKGASISARLIGGIGRSVHQAAGSAEGKSRFLAVLDGQALPLLLKLETGLLQTYTLAEALDDVEHELVLWKVSEEFGREQSSNAGFGGFVADSFLQGPKPKTRRLEFIGDSDTAGWCADGVAGGKNWWWLENTHQTWAARLARELNADYVAEAISGSGVNNAPAGRMQDYFNKTFPSNGANLWNPALQQIPDAVVILLGANDPTPWRTNTSAFRSAYRSLMDAVVSLYRNVSAVPKIIHVCGGSINGFDPCAAILWASDDFNVKRNDSFQSYFTSMTYETYQRINRDLTYQGCDSHYGPKGHEALKNEIVQQVRDIMGWNDLLTVFV